MSNLRKFAICQDHLKIIAKVRQACDYMRVNFKGDHPRLHRILSLLNDTNTPYYEDENGVVYTKLRLSMGQCLIANIARKGKPYPIFLYNEFDEKTRKIMNTHGRLDFYGSLYMLIEQGYDFDIQKLINGLSNGKSVSLSRYDHCVDLFFQNKTSIPSPAKTFVGSLDTGTNVQPFYSTNRNRKNKRTYISWGVGTKNDSAYYLRVYNKIADTKAKNKYGLYADYLKRPSVHRYEIQFMNRMTKNIPWKDAPRILGEMAGKGLFQRLGVNYKDVKYPKYEPTHAGLQSDSEHTTKNRANFIGRGATLTNAGHNPFVVLALGLPAKVSPKKTQELIDSFIQRHKQPQHVKIEELSSVA